MILSASCLKRTIYPLARNAFQLSSRQKDSLLPLFTRNCGPENQLQRELARYGARERRAGCSAMQSTACRIWIKAPTRRYLPSRHSDIATRRFAPSYPTLFHLFRVYQHRRGRGRVHPCTRPIGACTVHISNTERVCIYEERERRERSIRLYDV